MEFKTYDVNAWAGLPAMQRLVKWQLEQQGNAWRDWYQENGILFPKVAKGEEIEGLAVVYGVIDGEGDRYHPGLFKHTTPKYVEWYHCHKKEYGELATVKALWEVDRWELPASVQAHFPEATGGLVVLREYHDTENGRAARRWAHEKDLGLSPCFIPVRTTTRTENGRKIRDIYEAELIEISDAINPLIPGTKSWTGNSAGSLLKGRFAR